MLFSHYLLDEIADVLYHFNPANYLLDREGSYDAETALLFSYVYMLSLNHDAASSEKSIQGLTDHIILTLKMTVNKAISNEVARAIAIDILEGAIDIEKNLEQSTKMTSRDDEDDVSSASRVDRQSTNDKPLFADFEVVAPDSSKKWNVN